MDILATAQYTPSFEIRQAYSAKNLGKSFSYITFSLDNFISEEKKKKVTTEDLQQFYNAQNTQFRRYWQPEKRAGLKYEFTANTYKIEISEQDIKDYYEKNKTKNYIADPLKVEVEYITLKKLDTKGLSHSDIQKDLATNPSSVWAKEWKKMTPFARGEHKGALDKEAFLLKNEGDVSPVFETNDGPMIIKLVKRIARTYQPIEKVRPSIKELLINKAFKRDFIKDVKRLLDNPQTALELFISEKSGKAEQIAAFAKDETHLSQELFSLKKGEYSCYFDGEKGIIVKLTDIADRFLPDLDSIKDSVKLDYLHYNAQKTMRSTMKALGAAAAEKSFAQLVKEFGGAIHQTGVINPTDTKTIQEYDKKDFPIDEMMNLELVGSIINHESDKTSVIIRLDEVAALDENALLAAQDLIAKELNVRNTRVFIEAILASLRRTATISINGLLITLDEKYPE
jgi:hypothetical protein